MPRLRLAALAPLLALAAATAPAAETPSPEALLVFPVATATSGREVAARTLGAWLDEALGGIASVRLVRGAVRDEAVRDMARRDTIAPEELAAISRRANAGHVLLVGCSFGEGRFALEARILDAVAARELEPYRGEGPEEAALAVAAAAVRHVVSGLGGAISPAEALRLERRSGMSLPAWAALQEATSEPDPARGEELLRGFHRDERPAHPQASSEQSICFAVPSESARQVLDALEKNFAIELFERDIDRVWATEEVAIITAVGSGTRNTPGVAGQIFSKLGDKDVNVLAIAHCSSDVSISMVVETRDTEVAVKALHELIVSQTSVVE